MRFDVKEEILILRSSIFRSVRRWHAQHDRYRPETANKLILINTLNMQTSEYLQGQRQNGFNVILKS